MMNDINFYKYYKLFIKKHKQQNHNEKISFKEYICPICEQIYFMKNNKNNLKKLCSKCKTKIIEKEVKK